MRLPEDFVAADSIALTRRGYLGAVGVVLLLCSAHVHAGQWRVTPSVSVGETYTDNVDLAPDSEKRHEFITELNPGLTVRGDGRRVDVVLDYVMQNFFYGRESELNTTAHQLQLTSTAELVRRYFFIDVGGTVTRQAISPEDDAFTTRLNSSNATDVATWSISPYLTTRLGRQARAELRYDFSDVAYDDADTVGGATQAFSADVVGASANPNAPSWRVSYLREDVDYDNATDARFESIDAQVGWPLTRHVQGLLTLGYEDNTFAQAASESDPEGSLWLVGVRWSPDQDTVFEVQGGERYFGETYSALFSTTKARFGWDVVYTEENVSVLQEQLQQRIFNENAELLPSRLDFLELSDEITFTRRAEMTLRMQTRHHASSVALFQEQRESRLDGSGERLIGGDVTDRWRVTSTDTVVLSVRAQRQKFQDDSRVDELYDISGGVERALGRRASVRLTYRYSTRNSNEEASDFVENSLIGRVSASF